MTQCMTIKTLETVNYQIFFYEKCLGAIPLNIQYTCMFSLVLVINIVHTKL